MKYTAKIIKFPFNKKYKCKGHAIIKDNQCTMLILENEERVFIPSKFMIEFSRGWFEGECEKVKTETGGQVNVKS